MTVDLVHVPTGTATSITLVAPADTYPTVADTIKAAGLGAMDSLLGLLEQGGK